MRQLPLAVVGACCLTPRATTICLPLNSPKQHALHARLYSFSHYQKHFHLVRTFIRAQEREKFSADECEVKAKAVLGTYPFQTFLNKPPLLNIILLFYKTYSNIHAILAKIKAQK